MCALSAGSSPRQNGQRYVAGLRLEAGRAEYQSAVKKPSTRRYMQSDI